VVNLSSILSIPLFGENRIRTYEPKIIGQNLADFYYKPLSHLSKKRG
jgi:hypothetical protein